MKTWKAILVDDEPLARIELRRLLEEYSQIQIVGEAESVPNAGEQIELLQPDLVFLDINLGTQSGFDLLELTDASFQTIFITAYDRYAIRAFEINALDYLLKPVHPERLKKAMLRLGSTCLETSGIPLHASDKILISSQKRSRFIAVNAITFIEANGDYTNVLTIDGFKGVAHLTLKKWLERLPGSLFIQIHRSYIVNLNRIAEIVKKSPGHLRVVLANQGQELPISRNYQKRILARYKVDK